MKTFINFISEDKDDLVGAGNELYFAYSHNTDIKAFEKLDPPAKPLGKASIDGYKYVMEQFGDIRPSKDSTVQGLLWTIPRKRETPVNKYEQYYHKINVSVNFKGKEYKAFAYKMDAKHYGGPPSKDYINIVAKGYKDNNIPLAQLEDAVKEKKDRS
jgi:hypothetical protein